MKIIPIFAEKLYAFQYDGEAEDEYFRLLDLWTDNAYLQQYAKANNISDVRGFVEKIISDAEYIDDLMIKISKTNQVLESFFKPLNDLETGTRVLSLQKGKRYSLRIYAIKIDANLFVITGGAIKLVHKMSDHVDTRNEKNKLEAAKAYLKRNGVSDNDSFYDLINEDYED
jgi:hypothetical protein